MTLLFKLIIILISRLHSLFLQRFQWYHPWAHYGIQLKFLIFHYIACNLSSTLSCNLNNSYGRKEWWSQGYGAHVQMDIESEGLYWSKRFVDCLLFAWEDQSFITTILTSLSICKSNPLCFPILWFFGLVSLSFHLFFLSICLFNWFHSKKH